MGIIVQKYGGSSVANTEKLTKVCEHIIKEYENGNEVVVVVSAQGKMTDQLIKEEKEITQNPNKREHDVLLSVGEQISIAKLCMCLEKKGYSAVSLTGWQIPIITDEIHSEAKIKSIYKDRILNYLKQNKIVVVAGFQGINVDGDITTLGRGGSDTTAVALAAILKADKCDIYTDVDGVFSADPGKISNASKINNISYDEMLELSSLGAKVLHNRCVEVGKKYNIPICVKSTFLDDSTGTILTDNKLIEKPKFSSITNQDKLVKFILLLKKKNNGGIFNVINLLQKNNIKFDMLTQSVEQQKEKSISFCISYLDLQNTLKLLYLNYKNYKIRKIKHYKNMSKISIIGTGLFNYSEILNKIFKTLYDLKIDIYMITTSEIKISLLIDEKNSDFALRSIHKELITNT